MWYVISLPFIEYLYTGLTECDDLHLYWIYYYLILIYFSTLGCKSWIWYNVINLIILLLSLMFNSEPCFIHLNTCLNFSNFRIILYLIISLFYFYSLWAIGLKNIILYTKYQIKWNSMLKVSFMCKFLNRCIPIILIFSTGDLWRLLFSIA